MLPFLFLSVDIRNPTGFVFKKVEMQRLTIPCSMVKDTKEWSNYPQTVLFLLIVTVVLV